jgi:hypothetical protein
MQYVTKKAHMHKTQSNLLCSHLQHARKTLFAPLFEKLLQSTTLPAPTNWESLPESAPSKEHTMRNITATIVSFIFAASISGIFFNATLV